MNTYLQHHEWLIIESNFNPENHQSSESIFSIGNGRMGQRASFEESYSGKQVWGNFIGGVFYPDPTKVGYWKTGYPEYFAKLVNVTQWIGIDIKVGDETLDLAKCKVSDYCRILNMYEGFLERSFIAQFPSGKKIKVHTKRFISLVNTEIGAIRYSITPLNFSGEITITPNLNADVKNDWSFYGDKFLEIIDLESKKHAAQITIKTLKTNYVVCTAMNFMIEQNGEPVTAEPKIISENNYVANTVKINASKDEEIDIYKYAAIVSSFHFPEKEVVSIAEKFLQHAVAKGFAVLLDEHRLAWKKIWEHSDITIEGDVAAQQAIRFCIFQLNQTYTGKDSQLNIGPKGYTGEKYGGVTYWDTEAYCFPFYMATAGARVAKNLLLYRYNHLQKAIENAEIVGIKNGGALYPMVTVLGVESHNEWEITFEEIHRNGAIAYAIYNYVNYTGDKDYLVDYGLESLIALSRFWQARSSFSTAKNKYVILGVTGPNEYENNVNNNWYTNTMACWTMQYTIDTINYIKETSLRKYEKLCKKIKFQEREELAKWHDIIQKMHFPEDKNLGIFVQQDDYFDKEQVLVAELNPAERPLNQHWSWDRILRSCFLKQADVLQGLYFLEQQYDLDTIKRNFDFYEPRTLHESSLSPCVHTVLAAKIGYSEKAYDLYLRTARLDLDDYNNEIEEGCHVTSMAGSWIAIVQGFGGMRVINDELHFNPMIVPQWKSYAFKILWRKNLLQIKISAEQIKISNESDKPITLWVNQQQQTIKGNDTEVFATKVLE